MKKRIITIFLFILFHTFVPTSHAQLYDFEGNTQKIENYTKKGKWTVVILWASWCRISNKIIHEYVDFYTFRNDYNADVLGISMDGNKNKKKAQKFIDKHGLKFTNLIGEHENISNIFTNLSGASWIGTPAFLVYSPSGELRAAEQGGVPAKVIEQFIQQQSKSP